MNVCFLIKGGGKDLTTMKADPPLSELLQTTVGFKANAQERGGKKELHGIRVFPN